MNRLLHTIVLLRDRTMSYTARSAWRWAGILYEETPALAALVVLLTAYGVVRD